MKIEDMSEYRQQEYDFVFRTREILNQYEAFQIDEKERFEVTLFINCLVGLLVLPKEHWYKNLPDEIISDEIWGVNRSQISFLMPGKKMCVKEIATHLRNSISHYNFKVFSDNDCIITKVRFLDFFDREKTKKTFEAEFSLTSLKQFVLKLSHEFMNEMKNQQ